MNLNYIPKDYMMPTYPDGTGGIAYFASEQGDVHNRLQNSEKKYTLILGSVDNTEAKRIAQELNIPFISLGDINDPGTILRILYNWKIHTICLGNNSSIIPPIVSDIYKNHGGYLPVRFSILSEMGFNNTRASWFLNIMKDKNLILSTL